MCYFEVFLYRQGEYSTIIVKMLFCFNKQNKEGE